MMSEVVNDGDTADFSLHLQSPLHALEFAQGGRDGLGINAESSSHRRGSGGVEHVVLAGKRKFKISPRLAFREH